MLARTSYPQDHVDACRARVAAQVEVYRSSGARGEAFEAAFFNTMVIALDAYFMHRARGAEGKDGNPINEVRVVSASLATGADTMGTDSTIRFKPGTTVLGLAPGDTIALTEKAFVELADAYFAEIEKRFPE